MVVLMLLTSSTYAQSDTFFDQGIDCLNRSEFRKADSLFGMILKTEKDTDVKSIAYRYRGMAREALGKYAAAIGDFDQAILLDKNDISNYLYRGKAHMLNGNVIASIKDFEFVLQKDKSGADGRQALTYLADIAMDEGDFETAIQHYTRLIKIAPKLGNNYYMRGMATLKLIETKPDFKTNDKKKQDACKDLYKALSLGNTYAQELIQEYCE